MLEKLGQELVLSSLDHKKILRSLSIPHNADSPDQERELFLPLQEQILRCEAEILRCISPKAVFRILPVKDLGDLIIGNDIRRLLDGCDEAILMALTLGGELERKLMREEVVNMSDAYVLDICASQAVEEAADLFENRLRQKFLSDGKYLTNRYSPGYGDYPLSVQKLFLEYLNAQRSIGLTLTKTDLMVPRKSITAVLGVSDKPGSAVLGGCSHCPLLTKCSFLEHGERCFTSS